MIRIVSFNVNGIRAWHKKGMFDWLQKEKPDLFCVQETKAQIDQVGEDILAPNGYTSIWHSAEKKGYSGVATWCKEKPKSIKRLEVEAFDAEGRAQFLEYDGFILVNCYFPNSQPERKRLPYKLDFVKALTKACNKLRKKGKNVVICGDYNIAHNEIDLARPKQNTDNPGFYIEERKAMTAFLKAGYVDTFRHFTKDPDHYTWWSYRAQARARNVGWRIDYHCVNKEFIDQVKNSYILPKVMGSDHCPVVIELDL